MPTYIVTLENRPGPREIDVLIRDATNRGHAIQLAALRVPDRGPRRVLSVLRHDGRMWLPSTKPCEHPGRAIVREDFGLLERATVRIVPATCKVCQHTWTEVHCGAT